MIRMKAILRKLPKNYYKTASCQVENSFNITYQNDIPITPTEETIIAPDTQQSPTIQESLLVKIL